MPATTSYQKILHQYLPSTISDSYIPAKVPRILRLWQRSPELRRWECPGDARWTCARPESLSTLKTLSEKETHFRLPWHSSIASVMVDKSWKELKPRVSFWVFGVFTAFSKFSLVSNVLPSSESRWSKCRVSTMFGLFACSSKLVWGIQATILDRMLGSENSEYVAPSPSRQHPRMT